MTNQPSRKDWKLKHRYKQATTLFKHFTLLAEGRVNGPLLHGFSCPPGPAFMGMKVWASSSDQATDMICAIGEELGFTVTGDVQLFDTDPAEPPKDQPFGYDINFTPYSEKA